MTYMLTDKLNKNLHNMISHKLPDVNFKLKKKFCYLFTEKPQEDIHSINVPITTTYLG